MVEKLDTLLLLLGVIGLLAVLAERIKFPFPIILVLAGVVIAVVPQLPDVRLNPEVVLMIFLPPLLYSAAWNFPWRDFRSNAVSIFALAVGLVFVTILCVAYTVHWMIPGMTLATGFVLGAIVSPPDAVAATAVLKNLPVPRRLTAVLEGESLINDSSGLVAYHFAIAAVVTGSFSMPKAGISFVWMSVGGMLIGLVVAVMVVRLHRRLRDPAVEITLTILTPYMAYLPAERFGFSGVLAVVAAGLYVGHRSWEAFSPESRLQGGAIWRFIEYLLNGVVFILIGLQFPAIMEGLDYPVWQLIMFGIVVSGLVILVRFLWIFPLARLEQIVFRKTKEPGVALTSGALVIASWAGMRGVVSLAAAMAIPLTVADGAEFPQRHLILFLTFFVIFVTLILQGLSLPWLVRKLKVTETQAGRPDAEVRMALLGDIVAEIERLQEEADQPVSQECLSFWRNHYEHRLMQMQRRSEVVANFSVQAAEKERLIFPEIMRYARRRLAGLRDRGEISDEVRRRIELDFDLEERRIQRVLLQNL